MKRSSLFGGSSPEQQAEKEAKKSATKGQLEELEKNLLAKIQHVTNEVNELKAKLEEEVKSTRKDHSTELGNTKEHLEDVSKRFKEELLAEINQTKTHTEKLEGNHKDSINALTQEKENLATRIAETERCEKEMRDHVRRMEQQIDIEIKEPLKEVREEHQRAKDKVQTEYNRLLGALDQALAESEQSIKQAAIKAEEEQKSRNSWFSLGEGTAIDDNDWDHAIMPACKAYNELHVFWNYLSRREALDAVTGNTKFNLDSRLQLQRRCINLELCSPPASNFGCFGGGAFAGPDPLGTCISGPRRVRVEDDD